MSKRIADAFAWIVDYPRFTAFLIVLLTAIAVLGYVSPRWWTGLLATGPRVESSALASAAKPAKTVAAPDVERFNLTDTDVVLVVDGDNFFSAEGATALREMVAAVEQLDFVADVLWMDEVPVLNLFGLREPLFPASHSTERQFENARQRALGHPLVGGELLSNDGRTLLVLIRLNWLYVRNDSDCTERIKSVAQDAAAKHPAMPISVQVTGRVPMYLAFMESQQLNQRKFQVIGYTMTGLMALILFRGLRAVLIVSIAPALGVFWSLGVMRYFDVQDNPFVDVVLPVLLSLVALTDGVHLMVEIRKQAAAGLGGREAARSALGKIGVACALTSLTTAIGFASLGWAHHEVIREFGWSCVLGVFLTFLAVVTTIPLACMTRLGQNLHVGQESGFIEQHLGRVSGMIEAILRHTRLVSAVAIVSTLVLTAISLQLRPDERRSSALPQGAEPIVALEHMDEALGGLERGNVTIRWDKGIASDAPELITILGEVTALLQQETLIGHPLSIHSLLAALPGDGPVEQRASMLELMPPGLKRAFYEPEKRSATVTFRVRDLGIATYGPVFLRVQSGLKAIAEKHGGFQLGLSGPAVERWQDLYQIVVDLTASLGSATFVIFGVLMIAYRSIRLGLIAVVPNIFPLAATGTFLVLTGQSLEIVSVCAFTVCLGIAVDDTIHFLTRYLEERSTANGEDEAIRRAFTGTGTALIMTTVVLVTGFTTVLFSNLRDQRIFAAMGGLTIATALFADLVFLPALVSMFAKPRHRKERVE
ncbi:MAG: efflux RND transporter permease subunit [Planctomycetaceae bacterium]